MKERSDLSVSCRILVHMHFYSMCAPQYVMPFNSTQDGIGESVGISRAHASLELKKLMEMGLVDVCKSHSSVSGTVRKAYYLTGKGILESQKLIDRLHKAKIDERELINRDENTTRVPDLEKTCNLIRLANEQMDEGKNLMAAANLLEASKLLIRGEKR